MLGDYTGVGDVIGTHVKITRNIKNTNTCDGLPSCKQ